MVAQSWNHPWSKAKENGEKTFYRWKKVSLRRNQGFSEENHIWILNLYFKFWRLVTLFWSPSYAKRSFNLTGFPWKSTFKTSENFPIRGFSCAWLSDWWWGMIKSKLKEISGNQINLLAICNPREGDEETRWKIAWMRRGDALFNWSNDHFHAKRLMQRFLYHSTQIEEILGAQDFARRI